MVYTAKFHLIFLPYSSKAVFCILVRNTITFCFALFRNFTISLFYSSINFHFSLRFRKIQIIFRMIFVQDAFFFRNLTKHFFFKVLIAFYLMILYNDTGIKRSFDTYDSWEFTFFVL